MLDMEKIRKAVLENEKARPSEKATRWRLVPVGYIVECLEERAAVLEFDAGLTRESAERSALVQGDQRFRVYELILDS